MNKNSKNSKNSRHWFKKDLLDFFKSKNLKQTKQRSLIVNTFAELDGHIDAEELYRAVERRDSTIGMATIYRTLALLVESGFVEEQSFADGKAVYEIKFPNDHHDHLVCLGCGDVLEFKNDQIEALQERIAKEHGFVLQSHRLDMYGYCSKPACDSSTKK